MTSGFVFVTLRTNANQSMSDPSYLNYFVLLLSNLILAQRREHHNRFSIYRIVWKTYRDLKIEKYFFRIEKPKRIPATKNDSLFLDFMNYIVGSCVAKRVWGLRETAYVKMKNEVCGRGPGIFYEILSWWNSAHTGLGFHKLNLNSIFSGVRSCRSSGTSS